MWNECSEYEEERVDGINDDVCRLKKPTTSKYVGQPLRPAARSRPRQLGIEQH